MSDRELARQAALMSAIRGPAQAADAPGLKAYRGHIRVVSRQLLTHSHPTVAALVGPDAMGLLAWRLWQSQPPTSGDLGDWGTGLPEVLTQLMAESPDWQAWPYLADVARLDWACHIGERAPDAEPDLATLTWLSGVDPLRLGLQLRPGVQVLASVWPVVDLWLAHRPGAPDQALDHLSQALAHPVGQTAVVWRPPLNHPGGASPWLAQVQALPDGMGPWMSGLAQTPSLSLGELLAQQDESFDLTAWLTLALQAGWVWRVCQR